MMHIFSLSLLVAGSLIWAQEQYYFLSQNATWEDARNYCQACFKELATLTSLNAHLIVQNLSSDYWIGLRRSYNGSRDWSMWSNEDPVTYQNWYPGRPVLMKKPIVFLPCPSATESPLNASMSTQETSSANSTVTSAVTSTVTPIMTSPLTSPSTTTVPSPHTTPYQCFENDEVEGCPVLTEVLTCLNMTYEELTCKQPHSTASAPSQEVFTVHVDPSPSTATSITTTAETTTEHTTHGTTLSTTSYTTNTIQTTFTTYNTTANSTMNNTCNTDPVPDPDELFINDSCVVLLSFGMWWEKPCSYGFPFICYDVQFFGNVYVNNMTGSSATVSWSAVPEGNISYYKVELTGDKNQTFNETNLSIELQNLTSGTQYAIQVFPNKCNRFLNPQSTSFFTQPSFCTNLTVSDIMTDRVTLKWDPPTGNFQQYYINYTSVNQATDQCWFTIVNLTAGTFYNFTVQAMVDCDTSDCATPGQPISISVYTEPSQVQNLTSADNDSAVITASWRAPVGNHCAYQYCLSNSSCNMCNVADNCSELLSTSQQGITCYTTTQEFIQIPGNMAGSMYYLCVASLTNNSAISGQMNQINAYTRPNIVEGLSLVPTSQEITASWTITGNHFQFELQIFADGMAPVYSTTSNLTYTFSQLSAAVNYTVGVVTVVQKLSLKSSTEYASIYTHPTSPGPASVCCQNSNSMVLSWGVPAASVGALGIMYQVDYKSSYWNESNTINVTTTTSITIRDLKPGTTYDFNVSVVAGNLTSLPVSVSSSTVPNIRTLSFSVLCTSSIFQTCSQNDTMNQTYIELNQMIGNNLTGVYWKLKMVEGT